MSQNIEELVNSRNAAYDKAWARTGEMITPVLKGFQELCANRPRMILPWVTILCKLCRILGSPDDIDHWRDIEGYALLVRKELEGVTTIYPGGTHGTRSAENK